MSDGDRWCRRGHEVPPGWTGYLCPDHPDEELGPAPVPPVPPVPVPPTAPPNEALRSVCWRCGTERQGGNETCASCHESLVPPTLVIYFPAGPVILRERSMSAELGRAGRHGQVFAGHPNVSRRHATVGVDAAGDAWIAPIAEAPNGTFVNDEEIFSRSTIGPRDRIRFATDRGHYPGPVSERIRQPFRER